MALKKYKPIQQEHVGELVMHMQKSLLILLKRACLRRTNTVDETPREEGNALHGWWT